MYLCNVLGTSSNDRDGRGELVILNRADLSVAKRIDICERGVIRTAWHAGINQILATTANGDTKALYDPELSNRGALLCAHRKARVNNLLPDYQIIKNPNALRSMRDTSEHDKKMARAEKRKSRIPQRPLAGEGAGGRVAEHGHTITQHYIRQIITKQANVRDVDSREALLAMDEEAKKDPMFFGHAYKDTQPTPIYHNPTEEEMKEEARVSKVANERRQGNTAYSKLKTLNNQHTGGA